MTQKRPFAITHNYDTLPTDPRERHEIFVDFFGQFIMWLRNWSISASTTLIGSEEARAGIGTIRRKYYDGVAQMDCEQRDAAMMLAEDTVNGFAERLIWFLGGQGTDLRCGPNHAFRFQVVMEIIDVESNEVVEQETISAGGKKFFGSYWGRWLNRFKDK
jgi:hypothetical protein